MDGAITAMAVRSVWKVPPSLFLLVPPPPSPPSTPSATAPPPPPPPPPPPMQPRPAAERQNRLSLVPLVRDLNEIAAGLPAAVPSEPKSQMEWDEEETPRPKEKVSNIFRNFFHRREKAEAAPARSAAEAETETAVQTTLVRAVSTSIDQQHPLTTEKRKRGSVGHAREGIEDRRKLELSSIRAYDELMSPLAFTQQRALPPRRMYTKQSPQEASWPERLMQKASVRFLKKKTSLPGLKRLGGSSSDVSQGSISARSLRSPSQLSLVTEGIPPPVPPIPQQYLQGAQQSARTVSSFEQDNLKRTNTLPSSQGELATTRSAGTPSTTSEHMSLNVQPKPLQPGSDISPLLAYEKRKYATNSPKTPSSGQMRKPKSHGSSTMVNTMTTTPSLVLPHIPDDPFWDAQVAKVRKKIQQEEADDRRQQHLATRAEKKAVREVSKEYQGRFKWARMAVDELVGKYDEHGWQPKKDPKDFDDDDWKFVLEFLDREDTKGLRERLFKQPEWIEADKAHQRRQEEEMRNNPTPEFLAAQKAQEAKERKEYGFRKILGMLTAEEQERERLAESPTIGLGISNALGPIVPSTINATTSREGTILSSRPSGLINTKIRSGPALRPELEQSPSTPGLDHSSPNTLARHRVERMTGGFNSEGFDPRLSRLGSDEIKDYIKRNSSDRPTTPTPTPKRFHDIPSLDPRKTSAPITSVDPRMQTRAEKLAARRPQTVKKATSAAELRRDYATYAGLKLKGQPAAYKPPQLPTVGVHPTLRGSETSSALFEQGTARSQIPVLRKVKSSAAPLDKPSTPNTTSDVQRQVAAPPTTAQRNKLKLQRPPKPRKPSSAVKVPNEADRSFTPNFPSPSKAFRFGRKSPKTAPRIRRPSTSVKGPRSVSDSAAQTTRTAQRDALLADLQPLTTSTILPQPEATLSGILEAKPTSAISQQPDGPRTAFPKTRTTSTFSPLLTHKSGLSPEVAEGTPQSTRPDAPTTPRKTPQKVNTSSAQSLAKSSARLSRVPTSPNASDFFAVIGHPPKKQQYTSPSQSPSVVAKARLAAKQSGIPVIPGSNVVDHGSNNAGGFFIEASPPSPSVGKGKSHVAFEDYVAPREAPARPPASQSQYHQQYHQQYQSLDQPKRPEAPVSLPPTAYTPTETGLRSAGTEKQGTLAETEKGTQETQNTDKAATSTEGQAFHRIEDFDEMAQVARSYAPRETQSKAATSAPDTSSPTLRQMPTPAVVGEQMETYMPHVRFSSESRNTTSSKHISSPRKPEQQSMPATPSATDRGYRSFSEAPFPSRGYPETQSGRAVSLGNTQYPNHGHNNMVFGIGRLTRPQGSATTAFEGPRSAPLGQGHFDPFTPTRTRILHSDPRSSAKTPTSSLFKLRHMARNALNTDPVEQHEFTQDRQQPGANTEDADVSFEDVISAWQQSSPISTQEGHDQHASFQNQEIQMLRSDLGLEPIREHIPGDPKHPNHHYTWNTKKIMCRRIHNPGIVLPSLPSPIPGEPAHMSDYAAEYFVGSPYTDEAPEPERCTSCHSLCCRFAQLQAESRRLSHPTDLIQRNERRRIEEAIASLRVRKPNGAEEWDSFLKCSHCQRRFCPECIALCSEKMCQEPVCAECKIGPSELCNIHNVF